MQKQKQQYVKPDADLLDFQLIDPIASSPDADYDNDVDVNSIP